MQLRDLLEQGVGIVCMKFKEAQRQVYDILIFRKLALITKACLFLLIELGLYISTSSCTLLDKKGLHFKSRVVESHHQRFHAERVKENTLQVIFIEKHGMAAGAAED